MIYVGFCDFASPSACARTAQNDDFLGVIPREVAESILDCFAFGSQ